MADLALQPLPAAVIARACWPVREVELSRIISVSGQAKRLGAEVTVNHFLVVDGAGETAGAGEGNAAGA